MTTGVVIRRRAVSGETARGGFGLGDFFTRTELGNDIETTQRGGTLLPFVLRACCRGMCWPVDRPATHAAAGAAARGALIFCFGGLFHMLRRGRHEGVSFRATCLKRGRTRGLVSGLRAASGEDGTRGLVFRATCRLRRGRHEGVSFRATCRLRRGQHEGVRVFGGFNPLRGATAGAVIRRRCAAGATGRVLMRFKGFLSWRGRARGFVFWGGGARNLRLRRFML